MTEKNIQNNSGNESDAASKSLTDALRVSFTVLKVVMLALVFLFLTSGVFRVQPDEQGLVLRLGKVRGTGQGRILGPGLHWALPSPISEVVLIPVKQVQSLEMDSLWYSQSEADKLGIRKDRVPPALNPTVDGYCLTRSQNVVGGGQNDYNIVHARWKLQYRIDFPERFFRNVYYESPRPGEDFLDVAARTVDPMLEAMASDAMVTTMVNYSIDEAIVSEGGIAGKVKNRLQQRLDDIESGITVVAVQVDDITWPRQVDNAFQNLNKAQQESNKVETEARSYAETKLAELGGSAAAEVLVGLKDMSIEDNEKQRLLANLTGKSQNILASARAYRTRVVENAEANVKYLDEILPEYRKRPRLVLEEIYRQAVEEILANAEEKIIIQPGDSDKARELRILINRDPLLLRDQKEKQQK